MKSRIVVFLSVVAITLPGVEVLGSGSYDPPPSRSYPESPPKKKEVRPIVIDREQYSTGEKIFLGDVKLPDSVISEKALKKQTRALKKVKKDLPKKVAEDFDVDAFAGKLDKKQMECLEYYLYVRYIYPLEARKS